MKISEDVDWIVANLTLLYYAINILNSCQPVDPFVNTQKHNLIKSYKTRQYNVICRLYFQDACYVERLHARLFVSLDLAPVILLQIFGRILSGESIEESVRLVVESGGDWRKKNPFMFAPIAISYEHKMQLRKFVFDELRRRSEGRREKESCCHEKTRQ